VPEALFGRIENGFGAFPKSSAALRQHAEKFLKYAKQSIEE
jgi:hypothetical protein